MTQGTFPEIGQKGFKSQRTEGDMEETGGRKHRKGWRRKENGINEAITFYFAVISKIFKFLQSPQILEHFIFTF